MAVTPSPLRLTDELQPATEAELIITRVKIHEQLNELFEIMLVAYDLANLTTGPMVIDTLRQGIKLLEETYA